jgi:hypothetical protein
MRSKPGFPFWPLKIGSMLHPQTPAAITFFSRPAVRHKGSTAARSKMNSEGWRVSGHCLEHLFAVVPFLRDIWVSERFQVGEYRIQGQFDAFNVTNANPVTGITQTFGPPGMASPTLIEFSEEPLRSDKRYGLP